jgi:serine/threonine protein kinase
MPSRSILGFTTTSGWEITDALNNKLGTGGHFCVRYLARSRDGVVGFLKAMDLSHAIGDLHRLQATVDEYLFERDILDYCKGLKLNRVVTPLDAGEIIVPSFAPPLNKVYYVIFEKAEDSLRGAHFEASGPKWLPAFKALHHVAIGIEQLHSTGIAHQDIKPSNVLAFQEEQYKISDLGRVVDSEGKSPFKNTHFPGDHTYKPIEMFYGHASLDFLDRKSCDLYMLGGLAYYIIESVPINASVNNEATLIDGHVRRRTYSDALPVLVSAYATVMNRFYDTCQAKFGEKIAKLLYKVVFETCNPDISVRGCPGKVDKSIRLSPRRYVGMFANIVRAATIYSVDK